MAESFYGYVHNHGLLEFRDVEAAALEVGLTTYLTGRVELRCAGTVGIPSADLRALAGDVAYASHSRRMVA